MTDNDKPATRPGVTCICGWVTPFAKSRWGKFNNLVCPVCFSNIHREESGGPVVGRDLQGRVHELEGCEIIHKGI